MYNSVNILKPLNCKRKQKTILLSKSDFQSYAEHSFHLFPMEGCPFHSVPSWPSQRWVFFLPLPLIPLGLQIYVLFASHSILVLSLSFLKTKQSKPTSKKESSSLSSTLLLSLLFVMSTSTQKIPLMPCSLNFLT